MSVRRGERKRAACAAHDRDQRESAFNTILKAVISRIPGARAAALVDVLGETVDYAGVVNPYQIRLAAAHWRIVLAATSTADGQCAMAQSGRVRFISIRASRRTFLIYVLPAGYALVIVFMRAAGFAGWHRAVDVCVRALAEEAGWNFGRATPKTTDIEAKATSARPRSRLASRNEDAPMQSWFAVDVVSDGRRRPLQVRLGDRPCPVEILGALVRSPAAPRREDGWRVRFQSGVEATLVREPSGTWYSDEAPERPKPSKPGETPTPKKGRTKKSLTGERP